MEEAIKQQILAKFSLAPCPFCSQSDFRLVTCEGDWFALYGSIACNSCGASGPRHKFFVPVQPSISSVTPLVEEWNHRE